MKIVFLVHILVMDNFTRSKQVLTVFSSGENNEFVFLNVNTFMQKLIKYSLSPCLSLGGTHVVEGLVICLYFFYFIQKSVLCRQDVYPVWFMVFRIRISLAE